jgi:hypothetical protein
MYDVCPQCKGRGDIKGENGREPCPTCNGTGAIETADPSVATLPGRARQGVSRQLSLRPFLLWLLALLGFLSVLVLALLLLTRLPTVIAPVSINIANSNGNTNSDGNQTTTMPPTTLTPQTTGVVTQTPQPPALVGSPTPVLSSGTPQATPHPSATATPTPPAEPPLLAVSPQSIHLTLCVAGSSTFDTSNHGGGTLRWTAKASNTLYGVSPAQGSLGAGQTQLVQVTNITLNGSITVSSNGGSATVVITCG